MLGAIAAAADDQVDPAGEGFPGLLVASPYALVMLMSQSTSCSRQTSARYFRTGSPLPEAGLMTTWMRL